MKIIVQYLKILSLALFFLFLIQGCSFYAGFHVKSTPQSESRTARSGTLSDQGALGTASNQDLGGEK